MSEQQKSADTIERLQKGLVVALIAVVVVLVAVIAFRQLSVGRSDLTAPSLLSAPVASVTSNEEVTGLLARARRAMAESRLVTPAGDNAYEAYLAVLDADAGNRSAREAVNDLYGIAVSSTEQAIASGDFDDAARLAELLAKANPDSFTVNNLRQRIERGQAQVAAAELQANAALARQAQLQAQAQAQGVQTQATTPDSATSEAVNGSDPAIADPGESSAVAQSAPGPSEPSTPVAQPAAEPQPTPTPLPAATQPSPGATRTAVTSAPPVTSSAQVVREARLLSRVDPEFPVEAMRTRQQGWVEVDFNIGVDGTVSDVRVVGSRPGRIFDRAAIRAIQGWRFEPRIENGQPTASRMRQRFDFRVD